MIITWSQDAGLFRAQPSVCLANCVVVGRQEGAEPGNNRRLESGAS